MKQEELDELFPGGCIVTQLDPEAETFYDDPTFSTPRLIVEGEYEGNTAITLNIFEFEKDVSFTMMALEETSPGVWLAHTIPGQPEFLLSTNINPELRNALRQARREWYEDA